MTLFRRRRPAPQDRLPVPAPSPDWSPDMPPRPQRVQPHRGDLPQPEELLDLIPWQAAMSGPVNPRFDPCGYVLIKDGERP